MYVDIYEYKNLKECESDFYLLDVLILFGIFNS